MGLTKTFTDIADAIRSKSGTSETYTPAAMPQAILDIPTGGGEEIDWEKFEADDGKTRFLVDFSNVQDLTADITKDSNSTRGTIDWGDGTTSELTSENTYQHQYASLGVYVIEIDTGTLQPGEYSDDQFDVVRNTPAEPNITAVCVGRNANLTPFMVLPKYSRRAIIHNANPNADPTNNFVSLANHPFLDHLTIRTTGDLSRTASIFANLRYIKIEILDPSKTCCGGNSWLIEGSYKQPKCSVSGSFSICPYITEIDFSDVQEVHVANFASCTNLKSLNLPPITAQSITTAAFSGCSSLQQLVLNGEITTIGARAFVTTTAIQALIFQDITAVPTVSNSNAWQSSNLMPTKTGHGFIYLPDILVEEAKAATNWTIVADSIKGLSELPTEEQT